jgi:hypothetical protein
MAESDSARTERELAALRGRIEADLSRFRGRLRSDLDVREMVRRRPVPVIGGAVALGAVVVSAIVGRFARKRRQRPLAEIDELVERLGGRIDRMKTKTRERLRESIRREVGEAEMGDKVQRSVFAAITAALTAFGVAVARLAAGRFLGEPPRETRPR